MRQLLKKTWIGAGFFMNTLMSLFATMFFSSRKVARIIKSLTKEMNVTRKAFVLGNGPSLKEVLSSPTLRKELEQGDLIVTNRFAISTDFNKLRPKYYILMDPLFFDEEYIQKDTSIKQMYDILNGVDWAMILFLSREANLKVVSKHLNNTNVRVFAYNGTTIMGPTCFQNTMFRYGMGLPSSKNIIIPAIMLMINLGYKDIYIYGAEFSWTKNIDVNPQNNRVFLNNGHFFKENDIVYYEKGWYKWYLKAVVEMLTGTEQLAKYAKSRKTNVVNRTKGSFIDAFEYENPDNILEIK